MSFKQNKGYQEITNAYILYTGHHEQDAIQGQYLSKVIWF